VDEALTCGFTVPRGGGSASIEHVYEVAEQCPDGTFRSVGCFAGDGRPVSREDLLAAVRTVPTDEFTAAMCPPGSQERADLSDFWVVRLIALAERRAAALAAERAELIAALAAQRPADGRPAVPEVMDVSEWLPCELGMVHPYGERRVGDLIRTSVALTGRFPATLAALRRGEIDEARAGAVVDLLEPVDQELAARVEAACLPRAGTQTPAQLRGALRYRIDRLDAAARARRHARARAAADVRWYPTEDGMARLVTDLPIADAAACHAAIDSWARQLHDGGDDRPIGQLRTEVHRDLLLRPWERRPTAGVHLVVHATLATLRGDEPAEVDGHVVGAAECRALLGQVDALGLDRPDGGTLTFALHDDTGDLAAVGTRRAVERGARGPGLTRPAATSTYRPRADQRRFTTIRDRRCRHPRCTRRVGRTDLDHCLPWPAGATSCDNLCCLCRRHHRLKTHAPGWRFHLLPGGRLEVTTPSGLTRVTDPPRVIDEPRAIDDPPVPTGTPPGPVTTTGPPDADCPY
jgi:hypothetical protein